MNARPKDEAALVKAARTICDSVPPAAVDPAHEVLCLDAGLVMVVIAVDGVDYALLVERMDKQRMRETVQ